MCDQIFGAWKAKIHEFMIHAAASSLTQGTLMCHCIIVSTASRIVKVIAYMIFYVKDGPYGLPFPCRTGCPDRSCPAASWWNFQLHLYSECTQPSVMSYFIQGRHGHRYSSRPMPSLWYAMRSSVLEPPGVHTQDHWHTAKKIQIYVCPEKKLRGLSPNFHIHVSVSDLYIPTIGPPIFLQPNRQTNRGNMYKSLTETWMKELGTRPRSFIFVLNFRYSVFAVQVATEWMFCMEHMVITAKWFSPSLDVFNVIFW